MADREKTLKLLDRLRLIVPLAVLAICLVALIINVALSPDMLIEIRQRLHLDATDKSHGAAADIARHNGIYYLADNSKNHQGDIYQPKGNHLPAVVMVHGGGWSKDNRHNMDSEALWFAQHGYVVFNIEVPLVGAGGGFPRDICATKAALGYLYNHAAEYKIDRDKLFLLGLSSGAHVVLMAAYTADADIFKPTSDGAGKTAANPVKVTAVAAIAPPTDLGSMERRITGDYLKAGGFDESEANYAKASPITYVKTAIPTVFMHGNADKSVPYDQSVKLVAALAEQKIPYNLVTIYGADHFIMGESKAQGLQKIADFFARFMTTDNKSNK